MEMFYDVVKPRLNYINIELRIQYFNLFECTQQFGCTINTITRENSWLVFIYILK